ncbi:MAG: ComEC/Rec2 family competence protein [Acidobacteriaceae bacterium]
MPFIGAAKSWLLDSPVVEPLRLRRVPLFAALACFAVGDWIAVRWQPTVLLAASVVVLLAICWVALRRSLRVAILPVYALWVVVGCWCAQMEPPIPQQQRLQQFADGLSRTVRGSVVRVRTLPAPPRNLPQRGHDSGAWEGDSAPGTQSIDLAVQSVEYLTPDISTMQPTSGGIRVTLEGPPRSFRCGDLIEMDVRLRTPDVYRDPGAWSYKDYLLNQGIGATGSVRSSGVHLLRGGSSTGIHPTLRCRVFAAQAWASGRLQAFVDSSASRRLPPELRLSSEDAAMLNAMLFGDRTHLTHALRNAFERTGTFHLFVVSGLHVALLAAGVFWLLRRMRVGEGAAVLVTILCAAAYAELTGFGVPAQRALLMTAIYLLARWLNREINALNALGAAALAVLVLDPRALLEASFQMTFLVILAIAGLALPLTGRLIHPHLRALDQLESTAVDAQAHPRLAHFRIRVRMASEVCGDLLGARMHHLPVWILRAVFWAMEALLVSLIAELCMVLPMAIYFHRATLLALPLNFMDIPLLAVLLCVAIVTFFGSLLSPWIALVPAGCTALLLHFMRFTVESAQNLPLANLRTPGPAPQALAVAVAAILFSCFALRARSSQLFAAGVVAALLIPLAVLYPALPELHLGKLEVTAIDVGQGDSILVVSPSGETMLVDAGGPSGYTENAAASSWDVGEEVVAPYLWSRRIRRLDVVVLTHAHSDHMGGMPAILRDFHPRQLWVSIDPGDSPLFYDLLAQARAQHMVIRHLHAGEALTWSDLQASVLAPESSYRNPGRPVNDDSLVLRLAWEKASVLLEGDAEAPSEEAMLTHHRLQHVTLLKVGHHGSETSTTPAFLAAVSPVDAVISDGRHNNFGHPSPITLEHLEEAHIRTYRTDRVGAETFLLSSDGGIRAEAAGSIGQADAGAPF